MRDHSTRKLVSDYFDEALSEEELRKVEQLVAEDEGLSQLLQESMERRTESLDEVRDFMLSQIDNHSASSSDETGDALSEPCPNGRHISFAATTGALITSGIAVLGYILFKTVTGQGATMAELAVVIPLAIVFFWSCCHLRFAWYLPAVERARKDTNAATQELKALQHEIVSLRSKLHRESKE